MGLKSWETAAEQSTSGSPSCHWVVTGVWATTAMKKGEINAHCSSERVVGVPYDYVIALLV